MSDSDSPQVSESAISRQAAAARSRETSPAGAEAIRAAQRRRDRAPVTKEDIERLDRRIAANRRQFTGLL